MFVSILNFLFNIFVNLSSFLSSNNGPSLFLDAPTPWQIGFQDVASPGFEGIVALHDSIFFFLILISVSVFWILFAIIRYFSSTKSGIIYKYLNHGTILELIWTISPALVLIAIAFPSFKLLYTLDEVIDPALTVKVTGFLTNGLKSYILNKIKDTIFGLKSFMQKINKKFYYFYLLLINFIIKLYQTFFNFYMLFSFLNTKNIINRIIKNYYSKNPFYFSRFAVTRTFMGPTTRINSFSLFQIKTFHTLCRAIKRIGPHDQDIISVVFGLLLGDGYASNRSGEGVRISIKQSITHKEYLFWLYSFFFSRGYCSNLEPRIFTRTIKGIDNKYYGFEFNTYTFRSFLWIYESFYKNGKKMLPLNLELYFTPLTLAILISDDGTYTNAGVRIATNCFTLNEVEFLGNILKNKFNLDVTVQKISLKNQYSLYIKKNSIDKLKELVLPYLHPSMHYKIGIKGK